MSSSPVFLITGSPTEGAIAGTATAGLVNNFANAIYYNFISDGVSSVVEPLDKNAPSYYVNNGYINRWDRLEYTKCIMKENNMSKYYDVNAWRHYSEYGAHMYIWQISSKSHNSGEGGIFEVLANATYNASVWADRWDKNIVTNVITILFGVLGF